MYEGSGKDLDVALVAVNPQIVGFLLQRTLRAGEAHSETNALSGFLPYMHPTMIWGVEPVWSEDVHSQVGLHLVFSNNFENNQCR